ncbi:hypothetical protein NXX53_03105 [Bacteroides salyersiae]|nr:hypothetical protein [Bacteroides salyersiae]
MGAIAYEYVEDYYISQNIVEDVMMSIWEKREQLIISTSVKSYLLASVHNKCIDYLRSRSREAEVFSLESEIGSSSLLHPGSRDVRTDRLIGTGKENRRNYPIDARRMQKSIPAEPVWKQELCRNS